MKKIHSFLVSIAAALLFFFLFVTANAQTAIVDGNIFLQGETSHDSVMVAFERVAPTVLYDTAYTNSSGYFSKTINTGAWNIAYHKNGFLSKYFETQAIYADYSMTDTIMEVAICGEIKDTLKTGTYIVTCDLVVNADDTLVIESGVNLLFSQLSGLTVNGLLIAKGDESDRILFSWYNENERWNGININNANDSCILEYCDIEYSINRGLTISSTDLRINNIVVSNNALGGISINSCDPHLKNIQISFNSTSSPVYGGGIRLSNSSAVIENFIINNNSSTNWGGAISVGSDYVYPIFTNGLIYGNTAPGGGALNDMIDDGYATYQNCIFYNNTAYNPSYNNCMYIQGHTDPPRFENCIFLKNQKIFKVTNSPAEPLVFNSVFWDNVSDLYNISDPWMGDFVTENVNGDSTDAYGNLFQSPYLVDAVNNDFHMTDSSSCINAGPMDTTGLNLPDTDIEGYQRIYGGIVDIGPYEYTGCTVNASVKKTNITCRGLTNGMAIAEINGGVSPFSINWSTGESSDTIYNLASGNYSLTVTDAELCGSVRQFSITEPDSLKIGLQIFAASCGQSNGSAVAFTSGGTQPYSYEWDGDQGTFGLTGISAGNYHLLLSDKNGCSTDSSFYVPGPDSLEVDINKQDLTCFGSNDGYIALHPYGGVAPFQTQWDHGSDKDSISSLEPGVYNYSVTDNNQCFTIGSVFVQEPLEVKLAVDIVDASCGTNSGTATVAVYQGGIAPFSYLWSNGETAQSANNLSSGSYSVTVIDSKGCTALTTALVSDINAPEINVDSLKQVSCFGESDGSIYVSVIKGVQPYTYEWNTSDATNNISDLSEGTYILTVTDDNNCIDIETIKIEQPDNMGAFLSVENTQCGLSQGVISANVVGGTMPYIFGWSSGGDKAVEFGLSSGEYDVTITDDNGCQLFEQEFVEDINGPVVEINSSGPASCNNNDGFISLVTTGGTSPYTYLWSNGATNQTGYVDTLHSGSYEVTVIDDAGCQSIEFFVIDTKSPEAPQICVVTVDSVTGTNLIVWDKLTIPGIEKYRIYKERYIAGSFELTGEVSNENSVFNDEYANPAQRSWKYIITAVDECGNESDMSSYHETMHLTINASVNKDVNLIWNNYNGFSMSTYYIHRYARNTGWELIDSVPVSTFENKYTDFSPPPAHLTYYISYEIPGGGCDIAKLKSSGSSFNQSISNMQYSDVTTGVNDIEFQDDNIKLYPNPFLDYVNLEICVDNPAEINIEITNTAGQVVSIYETKMLNSGLHKLKVDVPGPSGLYFLKIISGDNMFSKKLLKRN